MAGPEDVLQEALQQEVRNVKDDQTLVLNFTTGKFNQHFASDQQASQVALRATVAAATQSQRKLTNNGKSKVRSGVKIATGYGTAIGIMQDAIETGSKPAEELA